MTAPVLHVEGLRVSGRRDRSTTVSEILHGVDLEVPATGMFGIVGESGSGKSLTAFTVMGLLSGGLHVDGGSVRFRGEELKRAADGSFEPRRGVGGMSLIMQNPRGALNPFATVGKQLSNVLEQHGERFGTKAARRTRVHEMLSLVGFDDPGRLEGLYPHEVSGGMAQRVCIAAALLPEPALLVADEPTTALDSTVQVRLLDLLEELTQLLGLSILLITHDLRIVARYCAQAAVMRNGVVIETGTVAHLLDEAEQEYTRRLVAATRDLRTMVDLALERPDE